MLEETKLIQVKKELVEFATLVESMVGKSITGLKDRTPDELHEVTDVDEPRANNFETDLDERCVSIIAQHQPAGKSLRTILMVLHINSTLERIGDHAVTIAESGLFLLVRPPVKQLIDIPHMAEVVKSMITDSIDSFINEDAELARSVCERDDIVDGLRNQILRELITYMTADPATIERSLQLMKIASNLERIADLTTNICEDVIYMVKGKVIKHHKDTV
ncbi:MAG: phosphate signaling complex protein PhoU [Desulfobacterota bacterium]|jgi:phosphate transport system protein|nr:phosphate signaling complex protein PhoU [Thermodesulfobacteriota bacterium]